MSKRDRVIADVCGGIAKCFDVDSTLVRLLTELLVLLGGAGVVAYIIAWIIVSETPEQVSDDSLIKRGTKKRLWKNSNI